MIKIHILSVTSALMLLGAPSVYAQTHIGSDGIHLPDGTNITNDGINIPGQVNITNDGIHIPGDVSIDIDDDVYIQGNTVTAPISRQSFANADLQNMDFSGKDLRHADFSNADLTNVNFQNANLQDADFSNVTLENVNLQNADLRNANFTNADIAASDMRGALVSGVLFINADFNQTKVGNIDFTNTDLTNADFEGADYSAAASVSATNIAQVLGQEPPPATTNSAPDQNYKMPHINLAINFAFDSDQLEPQGWKQIEQLAEALNSPLLQKSLFMIEGHTDSKGDEKYNMDLSHRRALSVMQGLARYRVASNRLSVQGHGESMPISDNGTDFGRTQNRRVTIVKIVKQK